MKKVLSMALMLMMVLTLFAVPAMAGTVAVELVQNGTFEDLPTGALGTVSATNPGTLSSRGSARIAEVDGNKLVIASPAVNKADGGFSFPSFEVTEGTLYTLTFDMYATLANSGDLARVYPQYGEGLLTNDGHGVTATDFNGNNVTGASSNRLSVYFPVNTWVKVKIPMKATGTGSTVLGVYGRAGANVTETGDYFLFDNVSVTKQEEGSYINITETNDFGTVTAPNAVLATETAEIKVVAEPGYYLASATLNGEAITFTQPTTEHGAYTAQEYVLENSDTARVYKEQWTYTLDGSALTEDANIVITYGQYNQRSMFTGGDASIALDEAGQEFSGAAVTIENGAFLLASGKLNFASKTYNADGKYLISFDAKATTEGTMARFDGRNSASNSVSGARADRYYLHDIPVPTTWKSYILYMDIRSGATTTGGVVLQETAANNGYVLKGNIYFDNIAVYELTEGGVPTPPAPTVYNVTINTVEGATTSVAAATTEGEAVNFTVAPKFGYYIAGITVGGNAFTGFDAYAGGTYSTGAVAADTAIVVTVASLADNDKGVSTDVATLPAVFAAADTAVTFGKVLDANATEYGIELTSGGVGVTPLHGGSYHYKANTKNANGQYAIEFIGLEAGTYTARTYVKVDGAITYGVATTIVVD